MYVSSSKFQHAKFAMINQRGNTTVFTVVMGVAVSLNAQFADQFRGCVGITTNVL